jgi:hypothetical protein
MEEALERAAEIKRLRAELREKEEAFAAFLRGDAPPTPTSSESGEGEPTGEPDDSEGEHVGPSLAERIRAIFVAAPGHPFRVAELIPLFPKHSPKLVRGTVNRIAHNEPGYENLAHGVYMYNPALNGNGHAKGRTLPLGVEADEETAP